MVIMRIACKGKIRDDGSHVQHAGELDPEFARRVHGYTDLERLADSARLNTGANTAPESCVQEDDIARYVENVRRKLLEIHNDSVGGKRDSHHLPDPPQPIQTVHRILEI